MSSRSVARPGSSRLGSRGKNAKEVLESQKSEGAAVMTAPPAEIPLPDATPAPAAAAATPGTSSTIKPAASLAGSKPDLTLSPSGRPMTNTAVQHALQMVKSEAARLDPKLFDDFGAIMRGNCVYVQEFACRATQYDIFQRLKEDLMESSGERRDWSKHELYENPTSVSTTFNKVVALAAEYFDLDVYQTRLNYYSDGAKWKPFHHDSHAYGGRAEREDFTLGISLGGKRELAFLHEPSGMQFAIPQLNGDCFAFTNEVNTKFMHGVPRARGAMYCSDMMPDRFSIIMWGRRRQLNERNGGVVALPKEISSIRTVDEALLAAQQLVSVRSRPTAAAAAGSTVPAATVATTADGLEGDSAGQAETAPSGATSLPAAAAAKKKKNRLQ